MRGIGIALLFVTSLVTLSSPAAAQYSCKVSTENDWLNALHSLDGKAVPVEAHHVHPVGANLPDAIDLLSHHDVVALSNKQVLRFWGADFLPSKDEGVRPRPGRHAYLVRAVFPAPNPLIEVKQNTAGLQVIASGLGCFPFVKHPLIVFLDAKPAGISVRASAAL